MNYKTLQAWVNGISKALLCALLLAVASSGIGHAASVTLGTAIPNVGDGVQNLNFSTSAADLTAHDFVDSDYIAADVNAELLWIGQTFTTDSNPAGYDLNSISGRQVSWGPTNWDFDGGSVSLRLFEITGDDGAVDFSNEIGSAQTVNLPGVTAATIGGTPGAPTWLTFQLDAPVNLSASSQYAFAFKSTGLADGSNNEFTFEMDGTNTDAYAGGTSISVPDGTDVLWRGGSDNDRAFIANMTALVAPFWNVDSNGNWTDPNNWSNSTVPAPTDPVFFGDVITENRTVTLDDPIVVNSVTFNNTGDGDYFLVPQSAESLTITSGSVETTGRHWLRVNVAGTDLNASGAGELVLDAANSFTGSLTVDGTTVTVANTGAIPSGSNVNVQNDGVVAFVGSGNADLVANGSAGYGAGSVSGTVVLGGGTSTIRIQDNANVTFSRPMTGAGQFVLDGMDDEGTGGRATFAAINTYTGATTTFENSILTVSGTGTLGTSDGTNANGTFLVEESQLVLPNKALGNEYLSLGGSPDGGPAKIRGSGTSSIAGNIYAEAYEGSHHEIAADAGSTLNLNGVLSTQDAAGVSRNFVFDVGSGGNINVNNKITDDEVDADGNPLSNPNYALNVSVIKRGTGTLTINTASDQQDNYWQDSTVIEEGTLVVKSNGSGGGELWSQTVTVKQNGVLDVTDWTNDTGSPNYNLQIGQNLGGAGTVNLGGAALGVFDDNSLSPGDGVGTLQINGAVSISSVGGGGSLHYELGNDKDTVGGSENDHVNIAGNLTTSGAAAFTVNVLPVEGALEQGNYRLISHTGGSTNFSGSTAQILNPANPDANNPLNTRQSVSVSGATAQQVNLTVAGTAANQTWTGGTDNQWGVDDGKSNWTGTGSSFFQLDSATFNASGSNQNINVAEEVVPASVTVTGSGANYSFSGNRISTTSVTVANNAVASFSNTVDGNVTVQNTGTLAGTGSHQNNVSVASGGTLRVGGATMPAIALGAVSWNVDNNGTIGGDGAGSQPPLTAEAGVENVGGWTNDFPAYQVTDLRDDSGNTTTLDIAPFSNSGTWNINGFAHQGQDTDGSWNQELLTGYLNSGAVNGAGGAGVVITEIPYDTYDIIAYFNSDVDTRTGTVSDGTSTYSFKAAGAAGSFGGDGNATYFEANALTTTSDTANYAVFSGLTGTSQTITVDIPDFGGFAGFQVVGDPGSTALAGESMAVLGDLILVDGSTIVFNIAGSGRNDHVDIGGSFSVADGAILEVLLDSSVSAASLSAGDSWDLFDFDPGSVVGSWDLNDFILPSGLSTDLEWDPSDLLTTGVLSVASTSNSADVNMDGMVDGLDFLSIQRTSPSLIPVWATNYGTGVGSRVVGVAVPEPVSIVLLLAGLCGLTGRSRLRA